MSTFIDETTQEGMIRFHYPDFAGLYALCACGYRSMNLPSDNDLFHDEICTERWSWHWNPLRTADCTGELRGMLHHPVHIYGRQPGQTSLRCSYCADAPTSSIHATCSTPDCWNPATTIDKRHCVQCDYILQLEDDLARSEPTPERYDGPCDCCDGPDGA